MTIDVTDQPQGLRDGEIVLYHIHAYGGDGVPALPGIPDWCVKPDETGARIRLLTRWRGGEAEGQWQDTLRGALPDHTVDILVTEFFPLPGYPKGRGEAGKQDTNAVDAAGSLEAKADALLDAAADLAAAADDVLTGEENAD